MRFGWLKIFRVSIQILLAQLEAQRFEAMKVLITGAGEHEDWYLTELKNVIYHELTAQKNLELSFVKDELAQFEALEGKFELKSFYLRSVVEYVEIMAKTQLQRSSRASADYDKLSQVFPAVAAEIKKKSMDIRKNTMEMWLEAKEIEKMW
jgi:hypothetical protein